MLNRWWKAQATGTDRGRWCTRHCRTTVLAGSSPPPKRWTLGCKPPPPRRNPPPYLSSGLRWQTTCHPASPGRRSHGACGEAGPERESIVNIQLKTKKEHPRRIKLISFALILLILYQNQILYYRIMKIVRIAIRVYLLPHVCLRIIRVDFLGVVSNQIYHSIHTDGARRGQIFRDEGWTYADPAFCKTNKHVNTIRWHIK